MAEPILSEWLKGDPLRMKIYAQEGLILEVTEAIWEVLVRRGMQKQELAKALGCSKGHVTQLLGGGRNMTLRTLADIAQALNCEVRIRLEETAGAGAFREPGEWTPGAATVVIPEGAKGTQDPAQQRFPQGAAHDCMDAGVAEGQAECQLSVQR